MPQHSLQDETSQAGVGFSVQEVAELLGAPPARVRAWVKSGLVLPRRGPRDQLRFSFRDLAWLRRVNELEGGRISPRRVRRALRHLRDAGGSALAGLGLDASQGEVVLRDGTTLWSPESGQLVFDFAPRPGAAPVVALDARRRDRADPAPGAAEDWYRAGAELERVDPEQACEAYRRALELDPEHADAAIDLGCLLHDRGRLDEAERHYRAALSLRPDATAWFNLAVVLEDRQRDREARRAYEQALLCDPACADAHFNLARLLERLGERAAALRHLTAYRRLSG